MTLLKQVDERYVPVVQDQIFVSAYRARASSGNSALPGEKQAHEEIPQKVLPDASLPGLGGELPLVVSSVFHPQRFVTI